MTAEYVSQANIGKTGAIQKLYHLSEQIEYDGGKKTDYIVISAVVVLYSGPETYIFPADKEGRVIDWIELRGSYKGGLNHDIALNDFLKGDNDDVT